MSEVNYQEAVKVLQNNIGERWDGTESNGRNEMARVLTSQLGYSTQQAGDVLDAMIASGTLRYHRTQSDPSLPEGDAPAAAAAPLMAGAGGTGQSGAPTVAGFAGAPAAAMLAGLGYWQIGTAMSESVGRKGQVDPTA